MNYKDLCRWAKSHGYYVERTQELIKWHKEPFCSKGGTSKNIKQAAFDIYNHITDGVWVEYQREEAARRASQDIYIDPMID